jgi:hypothetical protein
LESACQESLLFSLTNGSSLFLTPNHQQIEAISLEDIKEAMKQQLQNNLENIEITVSGDFQENTDRSSIPVSSSVSEEREEQNKKFNVEEMILKYLGTIAGSSSSLSFSSNERVKQRDKPSFASPSSSSTSFSIDSFPLTTLGKKQQLGVYLPDSDERAMGYIAGPSPNKWGIMKDGKTVGDLFVQKALSQAKPIESRWNHPLFGSLTLSLLQEVSRCFFSFSFVSLFVSLLYLFAGSSPFFFLGSLSA